MSRSGASPLDPWIETELAASPRRMLLVDGFNVLHTVLLGGERDAIWWGRAAREKLLERVCAWPESGDEIWVAFDGSQPAWSVFAIPAAGAQTAGADPDSSRGRGRGPIVHSLFVESADDWIVRRARRAAEPARTIVVSADRKVAGRARSAGCEVWSPWAFIAECLAPEAGDASGPSSEKAPAGAPAAGETRRDPALPRESDQPADPVAGDGTRGPLPRPSPSVLS